VSDAGPRGPRIAVYGAADCSLCGPVKATVRAVAGERGLAVDEVDITGVPELEARYRSQIPVVEIDGRRAFVYVVDRHDLERELDALAGDGRPPG
jgi:glutaredoxin